MAAEEEEEEGEDYSVLTQHRDRIPLHGLQREIAESATPGPRPVG
jgi:hypothetical protein